MPNRNEYKAQIYETIGLKGRKDYSEKELKAYDEFQQRFTGTDWKKQVNEQKKQNAESIETSRSLMKHLEEDFAANLPALRRLKEEQFLAQKEESLAKAADLKRQMDEGKTTLSKEEYAALFEQYRTEKSHAESFQALADFSREGSGLKSIGTVGSVSLSVVDDPAYVSGRNAIRAFEEENAMLDKYVEMRHAIGEEEKDYDPEKVAAAREKYAQAKKEFATLSGWQKFWGRILPASWYKPAETYMAVSAYKEGLEDAGLDPDFSCVEESAAAEEAERQELSEELFGQLTEDVDLEKGAPAEELTEEAVGRKANEPTVGEN